MEKTGTPSALLPKIRSRLFEIAMREPEEGSRVVLWVVSALFGALLLWAVVAPLDIVAVAQGRLVPQTYVKIVQPADAGIVRELLVKEGDRVEKGQVLVRLDPTESGADVSASERELAIQKLQVRRIDSELAGKALMPGSEDSTLFEQAEALSRAHRQQFLDSLDRETAARTRAVHELSAARETLAKLERTLPLVERTAVAYEKLAVSQSVSRVQADERRRAAIEAAQDLAAQSATVEGLSAAVEQSNRQIAELKSTYASELRAARVDAIQKITELEQTVTKLRYRRSNLELRAPQSGIVKELATTTVGAVVQPGSVIVSLVPVSEPLLAEVAIENQDIGFVKAGQRVRLKIATFPFERYGLVDARLKTIIADANTATSAKSTRPFSEAAATGEASFKAILELADQAVRVSGQNFPLAAGMRCSAEIVEGRRTVLQYLLSPLRRVTDEAGRET